METSLGLTIAPASILLRLNIEKLVPKDVSSLFYTYFRHHKADEGDIMVRILTDPTHCVFRNPVRGMKGYHVLSFFQIQR